MVVSIVAFFAPRGKRIKKRKEENCEFKEENVFWRAENLTIRLGDERVPFGLWRSME